MILCERDIDTDYEIKVEYDPMIGLQINVQDKTLGIIEWCKNTTDGKLAMDIYNHPYFYGFGLEQ